MKRDAACARQFLSDMTGMRAGDLGVACTIIESLLADRAALKEVLAEKEETVDFLAKGAGRRSQRLAEALKALAAYRSALRCGEPETERLKSMSDALLFKDTSAEDAW